MAFRISSSPFTHGQHNTQRIMLWVIGAAIPGVAAQCYYFGYGNLIQIGLAIIVSLCAESAILKFRKQAIIPRLSDNSALLTALLLGISIPPLSPWWMITIGCIFAIIIAKQLYGGLGQNPFNPAMVGYVVLLISFPVQMTTWLPSLSFQHYPLGFVDTLQVIFSGHSASGYDIHQLISGVDGVSQATPLDKFKTGLHTGIGIENLSKDPMLSQFGGAGWVSINIAFLLGGLILLGKKIIQWHIPLAFLCTLALLSTIKYFIDPQHSITPAMELLSGATMLGAFFIITDPVTASTTPRGRLIFGALIGFLVWVIRHYGGYPDAVAFAVLLANITVPLIDYYTQPRTYGHK